MTKYYFFQPGELEHQPFIEADNFPEARIREFMINVEENAKTVILQYCNTATKGNAPILFDAPLLPPPPKRGRPPKRKDKAPDEPIIIDSLAAPEQPDPEDGLFRAALLATIRGKPDKHTGAGMTRRSAIESAMDLFALTVSEINASPDTPGKKALLEALNESC